MREDCIAGRGEDASIPLQLLAYHIAVDPESGQEGCAGAVAAEIDRPGFSFSPS